MLWWSGCISNAFWYVDSLNGVNAKGIRELLETKIGTFDRWMIPFVGAKGLPLPREDEGCEPPGGLKCDAQAILKPVWEMSELDKFRVL